MSKSLPEAVLGPAVRRDTNRPNSRHPLLKVGTPHHAVWDMLTGPKASKGLTAAQLKAVCPQFHPQVLSDLVHSQLVLKVGKIGSSFLYAGDPTGVGIIHQQVEVQVEFYETENGEFVTRTNLLGRVAEPGKITRYLGTKSVRFDIPETAISHVAQQPEVDPEFDDFENVRLKRKTAKPADFDGSATVFVHEPPPPPMRRLAVYDPAAEDGCIIEQ